MSRPDFEEFYREEYGRAGMAELPARLDRAEKFGSSLLRETSAEDVVSSNNAGYKGSSLTLAQIVQIYCVERREPREGEGIPHDT